MSRYLELNEKFKDTVIEFNNVYCYLKFRTYMSGRLFVTLQDCLIPSEQVARITLDVDNVPIIDDMIIVKDYRENEGVYNALLEAKVILPCERKFPIGFDYGLICFLNI